MTKCIVNTYIRIIQSHGCSFKYAHEIVVSRIRTPVGVDSTVDTDFIDHDFVFDFQSEARKLIINADVIRIAIGVKTEALVNGAASKLKGEIKR